MTRTTIIINQAICAMLACMLFVSTAMQAAAFEARSNIDKPDDLAITLPIRIGADLTTSSPAHRCDRPSTHAQDCYAIDLLVASGTAVYSPISGTVEYAGVAHSTTYGLIVYIKNGRYSALLAHLSSTAVRAGDRVSASTMIGRSGSSTNGLWPDMVPHIHLALYRDANFANQQSYTGPYGGDSVKFEPIPNCTLRDGANHGRCTDLYRYRSSGRAMWIAPTSVTEPPANTPPTAPSDLRNTALDSSRLQVSWRDNSTNETGFQLWSAQGSIVVAANATSYTYTGLAAGTRRCVWIRAYRGALASSWIGEVCATTPTPTPNPSVTVTVDAPGRGFTAYTRQGASGSWFSASGLGQGGSTLLTSTNGSAWSRFGNWEPTLTSEGSYLVEVYIPRQYATARAKYVIVHRGGVTTRVVDQSRYFDQWVDLGVYTFGTRGALVQLANDTGEAPGSRWVGFDAMRWTRR
jgi:murein DD-endopeptidase MepM/ murein hydrolase activator NlpD